MHKGKYLAKKVWNKVFEILKHLLYSIFNIKTTPLIRPLLDSPKSGLKSQILLYGHKVIRKIQILFG